MGFRRAVVAALATGLATLGAAPALAAEPASSPNSSCQGQVTTSLVHEEGVRPYGTNWVLPEIRYYRDPANGSPFSNSGQATAHNAQRDPHPEFGCF